jgi:hypothetical protein
MTDEVFLLLQTCVEEKQPDDFLFTRETGGRVRSFRQAWESLCCAAGLGEQLCSICKRGPERRTETLHDGRR